MNYGNRSNNTRKQQSNNYWHAPNKRCKGTRKSSANGTDGQSSKVQCKPVKSSETMDANVSMSLVNGIKQGLLAVNNRNSISPVESPVNEYNCSPVHQQNNVLLPESTASIWQMDLSHWGLKKDYDASPKTVPRLNGAPYAGGPSTPIPSPIGSSRGSTYSNSSPPQAISGGSSPMMPSYFSSSMNGGRRWSAEEMFCKVRSRLPDELVNKLHDIGRSSSSQSPEEPNNNLHPYGRNSDSRFSDEVSYGVSSICRSKSVSWDDLSFDSIMGEFRANSPEFFEEIERQSGSSGSTKCKDCTSKRVNDNSSDTNHSNMLANVVDKSAQETHPPTIPITNQLTLPTGNQMVLPNHQMNITQKLPVTNTFAVSGQQLAVPVPSDDKPLASSSPLMFQNQRIISEQPIIYCSMHNGAQRFYCQTCCKLFCNACGPHVGHAIVHFLDASESAQKQAEQVLMESRFSIATIRDDIDKGVIAAQTLNVKAREAITGVRDVIRQLTESLRVRERELVETIETSCKSKQSALQMRDEGLKFGLSRLSHTMDKLNRSVENSSFTSSPLDLYVAKDTASAQIFHVKSIRNNLPPPEENFITFQLTDNHIIDAVRNLGNVLADNGHVGDRRLLTRPTIPSLSPPMPTPRACSVPGMKSKVSITQDRPVVNGNPYFDIGKPIMRLGSESSLEENLCRPWGVACDRDGHILIADRSNNRIQIFRMNGSFVRRFGSYGTGRGQFDRPAGITVDSRRRIVVADKDNHRIQVLTMEGEFLLCFGDKGTDPGLFNYPWDVSTNSDCQIVVSDTRNHRIQMFSAEGVFLRKFGFDTQPQLWKCLDSPRGVAFNNEGNIIVTDFNNHRIVVVDSDFVGARFLGYDSLAPHQLPPKTMNRPQGVAVDDDGHIIVCDSRNSRVLILDANGICRWRFGMPGSGPNQMDRPSGVAVSPDGKIVIVDFGNNRVLVF